MKWAALLAVAVLFFTDGMASPEEAMGRVVSVISADSLGIEMQTLDPRTNAIDSVRLADIEAPSTVTTDGKKAREAANSLLKNKTVYLDIDDNTTSGRNEWGQLICVVYLADSRLRPVWPPVNRMLVDDGYATVKDDKKNEFNASDWWKEAAAPEKSADARDDLLPFRGVQAEASRWDDIEEARSNTASILKKNPQTGAVSIGYR